MIKYTTYEDRHIFQYEIGGINKKIQESVFNRNRAARYPNHKRVSTLQNREITKLIDPLELPLLIKYGLVKEHKGEVFHVDTYVIDRILTRNQRQSMYDAAYKQATEEMSNPAPISELDSLAEEADKIYKSVMKIKLWSTLTTKLYRIRELKLEVDQLLQARIA